MIRPGTGRGLYDLNPTHYPTDHAMSFSNPPRYSAETATAYVSALLGLLGNRDPMEVMAATPKSLREAVSGLSDDTIRIPEAEDKWSVLQVVQHLADSAMVYGYRMRLIVAEDRPGIPGYDQNAWATNLRYNSTDIEDALTDFTALRTRNLRWLRSLTNEELGRWGLHSERGEESISHVVRLLAAHDLVHLNQIERIKATVIG